MPALRPSALALVAALAAGPALADPVPLAELSAYINAIDTAEAAFTQVNADGSVSTGRLFLHRPGRMRFEYAPPDEALVLANGGQVGIFDSKSDSFGEQYPLRRTPLALILGRDVDLARSGMVVGHLDEGPNTVVVARDPEHPQYGTIRLVFSDDPVALREWEVTDEGGNRTTVILGEMRTGMRLNRELFDLRGEIERRTE